MPNLPRKPPHQEPAAQPAALQTFANEFKSILIVVRDLTIAILVMLVGLAICDLADHSARLNHNEPITKSQYLTPDGKMMLEFKDGHKAQIGQVRPADKSGYIVCDFIDGIPRVIGRAGK
jgi:hypothetical protein